MLLSNPMSQCQSLTKKHTAPSLGEKRLAKLLPPFPTTSTHIMHHKVSFVFRGSICRLAFSSKRSMPCPTPDTHSLPYFKC